MDAALTQMGREKSSEKYEEVGKVADNWELPSSEINQPKRYR